MSEAAQTGSDTNGLIERAIIVHREFAKVQDVRDANALEGETKALNEFFADFQLENVRSWSFDIKQPAMPRLPRFTGTYHLITFKTVSDIEAMLEKNAARQFHPLTWSVVRVKDDQPIAASLRALLDRDARIKAGTTTLPSLFVPNPGVEIPETPPYEFRLEEPAGGGICIKALDTTQVTDAHDFYFLLGIMLLRQKSAEASRMECLKELQEVEAQRAEAQQQLQELLAQRQDLIRRIQAMRWEPFRRYATQYGILIVVLVLMIRVVPWIAAYTYLGSISPFFLGLFFATAALCVLSSIM